MKYKALLSILVVASIALHVWGIIVDDFWMRNIGQAFFLFPMAAYYFKAIPSKNFNFYFLFGCLLASSVVSFLEGAWYFDQVMLGLWLTSYIFLTREAIFHTEYEKGSKLTTFYFLIIVAVYAYLLSQHILEIERKIEGNFELSLYIIYYVNILVLAVAALIYYLNSFSKKSVFFICLTLSFIFADVLRDMKVFYFRDVSVEIVQSLIRFAAIKLIFLFFITREKKLRLLHLV